MSCNQINVLGKENGLVECVTFCQPLCVLHRKVTIVNQDTRKTDESAQNHQQINSFSSPSSASESTSYVISTDIPAKTLVKNGNKSNSNHKLSSISVWSKFFSTTIRSYKSVPSATSSLSTTTDVMDTTTTDGMDTTTTDVMYTTTTEGMDTTTTDVRYTTTTDGIDNTTTDIMDTTTTEGMDTTTTDVMDTTTHDAMYTTATYAKEIAIISAMDSTDDMVHVGIDDSSDDYESDQSSSLTTLELHKQEIRGSTEATISNLQRFEDYRIEVCIHK